MKQSLAEQMECGSEILNHLDEWYPKTHFSKNDPERGFLIGYYALTQPDNKATAIDNLRMAAQQGINVSKIIGDHLNKFDNFIKNQLINEYAISRNFAARHHNAALNSLGKETTEYLPHRKEFGRPALKPPLQIDHGKAVAHLEKATRWAIAENNAPLVDEIETTVTELRNRYSNRDKSSIKSVIEEQFQTGAESSNGSLETRTIRLANALQEYKEKLSSVAIDNDVTPPPDAAHG